MSDTRPIVCKFGGTSMADGEAFQRVAKIIRDDTDRRYVVVSAPGKRHMADTKVTNLLFDYYDNREDGVIAKTVLQTVEGRYRDIAFGLELDKDWVEGELYFLLDLLRKATSKEFIVSRGEWMNAKLLARHLSWPFLDSADCIRFFNAGAIDVQETRRLVSVASERLDHAVIPGYYGADEWGRIVTFSRGGSDISGALVAIGVGARVYENWKDVPGLHRADPRIVPNAEIVAKVSPEELLELAYTGVEILHPEAIDLVRQAGIPVHICDTNRPDLPGTMLISDASGFDETGVVTGIAGRIGFSAITVSKKKGFLGRLLSVFEKHDITIEHTPSGVHNISVIVPSTQLNGKTETVLADIQEQCKPDRVEIQSDIALIATVGRGMRHVPGTAAKLFMALGDAGINIRVIDQGSSEINIIVGVDTKDFETAIRAIYAAFFQK